MGLTAIIYREIGDMVNGARKTSLDLRLFVEKTNSPKKNNLRTELKKIDDKLAKADYEIRKVTHQEVIDFTAETFTTFNKAYKRLKWSLPDTETLDKITNNLLLGLDQTPTAKEYEKVKKRSTVSAVLGGLSLAGALYIDAIIPAFFYATATYSAILQKFSKKESVFNTVWANLGIMLGTYATIIGNNAHEVAMGNYVPVALNLLHIPAYILASKTLRYFMEKSKYTKDTKKLKKTKIKMDKFVLSGMVIQEASAGLGYIQRVCNGNAGSIELYRKQIDNLEKTLTNYLVGKATYEDVISARIKYIHPEKEKIKQIVKTDNNQNTHKKTGYTREEYLQLKAERKERKSKKRKSRRTEKINMDPVEEISNYDDEIAPQVTFSDTLEKRRKKGLLGGYKLKTLMDLTQQKIIYHHKGELIRDAQSGKIMLDKLRQRHNLPEDANIYKMQPIGALRTLYTRNNGDVKVLEIMTHEEYNTWLKKL